jgi:protein phosphatase 1 regulatory subunit 37
MALSVGLKVNRIMRCLDVNVPPNDSEMARLSREILRCCVRNTELVAGALLRAGTGSDTSTSFADMDSEAGVPGEERGSSSLSMSEDLDLLFGSSARGGVWVLIERSELARGVKQEVERERVGQERQAMGKLGTRQKLEIWNKTPEEIMKAARDLVSFARVGVIVDWCLSTVPLFPRFIASRSTQCTS